MLLKSRPQQPTTAFCRNVIREARKLGVEEQRGGWVVFFDWLKRPAIAAPVAIGAAAAVIAALTMISPLVSPPDAGAGNQTGLAVTDSAAGSVSVESVAPSIETGESVDDITKDIEMIDQIGELVAITDPSELDLDALGDLLY